jgi:hypothetical protein
MSILGNCAYANSDISKIYLTKWTNTVETYFATDGSKVIYFSGLTQPWSEIILNTSSVTYSQTLNPPGPNGITYDERVTIILPNAEADKWAELVAVLRDRYIIIFKDANENWWVLSWRFGTKVLAYTLEENEYSLTFINSSSISLLTSVDESYVNSYVI